MSLADWMVGLAVERPKRVVAVVAIITLIILLLAGGPSLFPDRFPDAVAIEGGYRSGKYAEPIGACARFS